MTSVTIISGFLGAGKTTLIRKLLKEVYHREKVVLIENEFGEIGIDKDFLEDAGIEITEMNSGCICCSLIGDFKVALKQVVERYHPQRILIEPSGVGKLSDVIEAIMQVQEDELKLEQAISVVDAKKAKMYAKNFGEFFQNQIAYANTIVFSRTQDVEQIRLQESIALLKKMNEHAVVVTTPWDCLDGEALQEAIIHSGDLRALLLDEMHDCDTCECHHEHHHTHHHADEVFQSIAKEITHILTYEQLKQIASSLSDDESVLRAKGIIKCREGWYHFDVTANESVVYEGRASYSSRYCVIGVDLKEDAISALFEEV